MDELTPMKKGNIQSVFTEGSEKYPSVILASVLSESEDSEILLEYSCESEEHTFIRWSAVNDRNREFFAHSCALCDSENRESMMMGTCVFDSEPFNQKDEHIFRDSGVVAICRDCYDEGRSIIKDASKENESEFVAFKI